MSDTTERSWLSEQIDLYASIDPDAPELEVGERWWTWRQIMEASDALVSILEANGIGPDMRVGMLLRNSAPMVPALIAMRRQHQRVCSR